MSYLPDLTSAATDSMATCWDANLSESARYQDAQNFVSNRPTRLLSELAGVAEGQTASVKHMQNYLTPHISLSYMSVEF